MARLLTIALALPFVACDVWGGSGNARIVDATAGFADKDKIEIWATLDFQKVPEVGDPRQVEIKVAGTAARFQQDFDWEYIASHDQVRGPTGDRIDFITTDPADPPVLNRQIEVPLHVYPKRELLGGAQLSLHLFWGGERQHHHSVDVNDLYASYE